MLKVSAPGKLVIAGEWSVLESGNPVIVASVDRFVHVFLKPRKDQQVILNLPDFNLRISGELKNQKLIFGEVLTPTISQQIIFIKASIETVASYLNLDSGFELTTNSSETIIESESGKIKFGLGSSAGITVATTSALLQQFHPKKTLINLEDLTFKLAIISHFQAQNQLGSGLDIATAVYGGVIAYSTFDSKWLVNKINSTKLEQLVQLEWPNCSIEKLTLPVGLIILTGFTGCSASSTKLITEMNEFQKNHPLIIEQLYQKIANNTKKLIMDWKNSQLLEILSGLKNNHLLLKELAKVSKVPLITKELQCLITLAEQHGFTSKFSGAGGGDCGLAFGDNLEKVAELKLAWIKAGILPLEINLGKAS